MSIEKNEELEAALTIWQKTIDVQMHFNELQMKVRNFSILLISSLVGVGGIAMKEHISLPIAIGYVHLNLALATVLFFVALVVWLAFFFMDHFWYYPLLIGSVNHGRSIEDALKAQIPSIGLTNAIGTSSAITFCGKTLRSKQKSIIFYGLVFFALALLVYCSAMYSRTITVDAAELCEKSYPSQSSKENVISTLCSPPKEVESTRNVIINQTINSNAPTNSKSIKSPDASPSTHNKCKSADS